MPITEVWLLRSGTVEYACAWAAGATQPGMVEEGSDENEKATEVLECNGVAFGVTDVAEFQAL